jgi:hypothetical protein
MCGIRPVLFTTHINVATFAQNEQGQAGEQRKSHSHFPHTTSFKKKALRSGEPEKCPGLETGALTHFTRKNQSLA